MLKHTAAGITLSFLLLSSTSSLAAPASPEDISRLRQEVTLMKQHYEQRIAEMEKKLAQLQPPPKTSSTATPAPVAISPTAHSIGGAGRQIYDNSFNPSIGILLNGKYTSYSEGSSDLKGFAVGEEGARGREGLGLDESELNFASNVDDKFYGSLTAAIVREDGEDKIELEEAYLQTLPGMPLPTGMEVKAGRAFWKLGYLNEHHSHTDNFADRPLPNRVFLNQVFNDDGIQLSYLLPMDFYTEVGGGAFRGDDFPGGNSTGEGAQSYSLFARTGGDISTNQSWHIGGSYLASDARGRNSNENALTFTGDNNVYIVDARYDWAPTGNPKSQMLSLQGEYFWHNEDGTYQDNTLGTDPIAYDKTGSGWYGQTVYKFLPQWRVGYRYTALHAPDVPSALLTSTLDTKKDTLDIHGMMVDWTNSEFSRIRLQYNHDNTNANQTDHQFILQYIMSIGAHGAHKY